MLWSNDAMYVAETNQRFVRFETGNDFDRGKTMYFPTFICYTSVEISISMLLCVVVIERCRRRRHQGDVQRESSSCSVRSLIVLPRCRDDERRRKQLSSPKEYRTTSSKLMVQWKIERRRESRARHGARKKVSKSTTMSDC